MLGMPPMPKGPGVDFPKTGVIEGLKEMGVCPWGIEYPRETVHWACLAGVPENLAEGMCRPHMMNFVRRYGPKGVNVQTMVLAIESMGRQVCKHLMANEEDFRTALADLRKWGSLNGVEMRTDQGTGE